MPSVTAKCPEFDRQGYSPYGNREPVQTRSSRAKGPVVGAAEVQVTIIRLEDSAVVP